MHPHAAPLSPHPIGQASQTTNRARSHLRILLPSIALALLCPAAVASGAEEPHRESVHFLHASEGDDGLTSISCHGAGWSAEATSTARFGTLPPSIDIGGVSFLLLQTRAPAGKTISRATALPLLGDPARGPARFASEGDAAAALHPGAEAFFRALEKLHARLDAARPALEAEALMLRGRAEEAARAAALREAELAARFRSAGRTPAALGVRHLGTEGGKRPDPGKVVWFLEGTAPATPPSDRITAIPRPTMNLNPAVGF